MFAKAKNRKKTKFRQRFLEPIKISPQTQVFLFKIAVFIVLVFLIWSGWDYTKPNNFPIKQVKIISTYEHVGQKFLQKTIASYTDSGFFYLNVVGMQQQLLKLPWIYAISVQRQWPDTIVVNIVEQQAIAQWGNLALVNHKGSIFTPPVSTFPKELPIIFGPKGRELEIFTLYQNAQKCFASLDLSIKRIVLHSEHYFEILLSNDMLVYLKENDPLSQIEFLIDIYQRITIKRKYRPKIIDLRYYNGGFAVKWE